MKPRRACVQLLVFSLLGLLVVSLVFVGRLAGSLSRPPRIAHAVFLKRVRDASHNIVRVDGLNAAETYLNTVRLNDGPLYVLVTSLRNGSEPDWCELCDVARQPVATAFANAPPSARLLWVQVTEEGWETSKFTLRPDAQLEIRELPTLLRYNGRMVTTLLLAEAFVSDPLLLAGVFATPPTAVPVPRVVDVTTIDEMNAALNAFDGAPLFLYFVSGRYESTGRLWCPHCDRADVPILGYYRAYAPPNATLLRIVVAKTIDQWHDVANPFRTQSAVKLTGLPMLTRLSLSGAGLPQLNEYVEFFEDRDRLRAFFEQNQAPTA
ncbi:hypothetical protein SPRG_03645 [Saprolegnia parasitica CBS 223.65]|uniref:Thioredoxin domain-containing protein n=1 Tax=Saprolegnia parasitica (strain CBS 223.65) TaxID=695850 RepID=A0A067CMM2_SAPPC|nr:hypothetical protein SPRG_03645 [Saprolegnia parasitica CBS 223.65]KDO31728.1 hypothetical protein SPRG_03645 [Saprolegnia parasitica CBS 223.65]|eukprot:XP_012197610.1 hypothetical protein SPRG_03645 [Saprolegnia parasitica CBS 223.65]